LPKIIWRLWRIFGFWATFSGASGGFWVISARGLAFGTVAQILPPGGPLEKWILENFAGMKKY
jgi:hypothetical protein